MTQREAGMSSEDFAKLLEAAGLNQSSAARALEVSRRTVIRWLNGESVISVPSATHIKSRIKPKK